MAKPDAHQPLIASLLDRLIDHEPEVTRETHRSRTQIVRELKDSVRRDLENLLNTRPPWHLPSDRWSDLQLSLANYGLPDFTGANLSSDENRERYRQVIEDIIRRYEPRFGHVRVVLLDEGETLDRTLNFRIEALLRVEPEPEPISFDSIVEPIHRTMNLQESARG